MNLICSDCIGGRYFQKRNEKYGNPFIWNSIRLSNFIELIKDWDNIDLSKIKLSLTNGEYGKYKDLPKIVINNKVNLYFHHHKQDKKYEVPTKINIAVDDIDLGYKDILSYLKENWLKRVKRMNGEPVFCYNDKKSDTDVDVKKFIELETKYKKILVTMNKEYKKFENEKLKVHIKPHDTMYSTVLCNDLFKNGILK